MTVNPDRSAIPTGAPWSVEELADLHAGMYSPDGQSELRRRIAGDPEAAAVLRALSLVVDDLSLLPTQRMPDRFAQRLDAAVAAEGAERAARKAAGRPPATSDRPPSTQGPSSRPPSIQSLTPLAAPPALPRQYAPPHRQPPDAPHPFPDTHITSLGTAPSRSTARPADTPRGGRRNRWLGGLAVAAAVAAIGTVTITSLNKPAPTASAAFSSSRQSTTGKPTTTGGNVGQLSGAAAPKALELAPGRFQDALPSIEGAQKGPLSDPVTFAGCLAANKIAGAAVRGVTGVSYQGSAASAIAVKIDATHTRVVVVGRSCGINGAAAYLAEQTITR